jgi:hypothetical protein
VSRLIHEVVLFGTPLSHAGFDAIGTVADSLGGDRVEQVSNPAVDVGYGERGGYSLWF